MDGSILEILDFGTLFCGRGLSDSEKLEKLGGVICIKRKPEETDKELLDRLNEVYFKQPTEAYKLF